jgi:hypothetical protein
MKRLVLGLNSAALVAAGGSGSGGGRSGGGGGRGGGSAGSSGSSDAPIIKTSSGGQTVCRISRSACCLAFFRALPDANASGEVVKCPKLNNDQIAMIGTCRTPSL